MLEYEISALVEYAEQKNWIAREDKIWAANRILEILETSDFDGLIEVKEIPEIQTLLDALCDNAYDRGLIDGNSAAYYDLLDTKLIGALMPRPAIIIEEFNSLYRRSPKQATDWYYALSGDSNYIRRERIKKDRKWTVDSAYGVIDISINLSKPEKDPKAIAAAAQVKAGGYPKCLLCAENEGFAGHLSHPARQNHRIIPIVLGEKDYFLQYSPYVYYNEHCIVFNKAHTPMHIDRTAFDNLLDFVTIFPHYFVGSNADLPIVGGSVLSHDHYQGGRYDFAMAKAGIRKAITIRGFEDLKAGIVNWPMSVIRLSGKDRARIAEASEHILKCWRAYDDPEADILHETNGEPHSTITPICRRRGEEYEMDLVLRNNRTTEERPLGIFHPSAEKHHIKKENIGLIEVMGLAILPARLKKEIEILKNAILKKEDIRTIPEVASHAEWAEELIARRKDISEETIQEILEEEIGKVFVGVLEDAGVYKHTQEGCEAFDRFLAAL